jgi:Polyketide cyclase / dehydrase and lipid transport.
MDDGVTGAGAEVELVVDLPIDEVWSRVTDVSRTADASPECVFAAWRPDQGDVPRTGARFDARNTFPSGFTGAVECVVTDGRRPRRCSSWSVLDGDRDVDRPGSIWRYELEREGRGTRVRHRFTHGPGMTGLRADIQDHPDRARATLEDRLAVLRANMNTTLRAMLRADAAARAPLSGS